MAVVTPAPEERERALDAVYRAAREAAEAPLSAEEDGELYFGFITATALDLLAREGLFPAAGEIHRLITQITGYEPQPPPGREADDQR